MGRVTINEDPPRLAADEDFEEVRQPVRKRVRVRRDRTSEGNRRAANEARRMALSYEDGWKDGFDAGYAKGVGKWKGRLGTQWGPISDTGGVGPMPLQGETVAESNQVGSKVGGGEPLPWGNERETSAEAPQVATLVSKGTLFHLCPTAKFKFRNRLQQNHPNGQVLDIASPGRATQLSRHGI